MMSASISSSRRNSPSSFIAGTPTRPLLPMGVRLTARSLIFLLKRRGYKLGFRLVVPHLPVSRHLRRQLRELLERQLITIGQCNGTEDRIFKLADISGPAIAAQKLLGCRMYAPDRFAELGNDLAQNGFCKRGDVIRAGTQRR